MRAVVQACMLVSLTGCMAIADSGMNDALLIDDVRAPCELKNSAGVAADADTQDTHSRFTGDVGNGVFGSTSDVVGDVDGDGCLDVAVVVTDHEVTADGLPVEIPPAVYVLLFRGPFASGVFDATEADARIDLEPGLPGDLPPRSAGDTNLDGRDDLWMAGRLLESPFLVRDDLARATAELVRSSARVDVVGGFDADEDGVTDALAVYDVTGAAIHYGPFQGEIEASDEPTDQSFHIKYQPTPDALWTPVAQWVGELDGSGVLAAVTSYWHYFDHPSGWVVDVAGDRRKQAINADLGEGVLLEDAVAVPDVTGDGIPDFLWGSNACDGASVPKWLGNSDSCVISLPGVGKSAADIDDNGIAEIVVPEVGLYAIDTEQTYEAPEQGVGDPTLHQGDLTGDGVDDVLVYGWASGYRVGTGELRLYSGAELAGK